MNPSDLLIDDSEFLTPLYVSVAEFVRKYDPHQARDRKGQFTEQASITLGDRRITVTKPERATRAGDKLVPLSVTAFDDAFSREEGFYLEIGGKGGIGTRYERFGQFIAEHDAIEAAEVTVQENGRVGFTNGRHRYAWLRDQGLTSIPVAMTPESVTHAKRHGLLAAVKKAWDESKHPRDAEGQFTAQGLVALFAEGKSPTGAQILISAEDWGYGSTKFILPSGKRLAHMQDTHAAAAHALGVDLDDVMRAGILRYTPGSGAEIGAPMTKAQAQHLVDSTIESGGNHPLFVDVFHGKERFAKVFDPDRANANTVRNWVNSHFKVQKQEHAFGNTQIEIDPLSSAAAILNTARDSIRDSDLAGDGKDVDPNHVTVRYGLVNEDLDRLRAFIAEQAPFEAQVLGAELFPASEHSDGAVPVVALIASAELREIEKEIGRYADYKEKSFPVYKPHCTLAYCKPEKAERYADLYVDGSFIVRSITISHASGVMETIPFGMTVQKKDPQSGRYVTPFVSFDRQGDAQLQMIASLNSSRLATWGFTAEAEVLGMARYRLTAVLDGRTSKFCRLIDGKIFQVPDARKKVIEVLEVQNPEDLRTVQPWPKQTKAALAEFAKMTPAELTARGLHIPPYHPYCRTICRAIQTSAGEVTEVVPTVPTQTEVFQPVTAADLKEMGIDATPEQVAQWNEHVGMTPVELLSKLSGLPPQEVMTKGKGVGSNPIQFDDSGEGNIGFDVRGADPRGVEFKLHAILEPFTGIYYLTQAELLAGSPKAELAFLKNLFSSFIEMGLKSSATSLALGVAGNAPYYAKLGFLPDELEWNTLRTYAQFEVERNEAIKALLSTLSSEDRLLVQHLLLDRSPWAMSALVELPFTYGGRTLGEWLFGDATGTWALDLTDDLLVAQARAYLS